MTAASVKIWNGVVGEVPGDRETVWIVSVHCADGSDAPGHEWGVHDEQDEAEDDAAARGARLGLPVIDERDTPPSNVIPFVRPSR